MVKQKEIVHRNNHNQSRQNTLFKITTTQHDGTYLEPFENMTVGDLHPEANLKTTNVQMLLMLQRSGICVACFGLSMFTRELHTYGNIYIYRYMPASFAPKSTLSGLTLRSS